MDNLSGRVPGKDIYFDGPLDAVRLCSELCAGYPTACQRECPNYVVTPTSLKSDTTSSTTVISTSTAPAIQDDTEDWLVPLIATICAIIVAVSVLILLYKKCGLKRPSCRSPPQHCQCLSKPIQETDNPNKPQNEQHTNNNNDSVAINMDNNIENTGGQDGSSTPLLEDANPAQLSQPSL